MSWAFIVWGGVWFPSYESGFAGGWRRSPCTSHIRRGERMHRTFSVPRLIGWWSLLIALTLQVGIHAASAQNPLQPAPFAPAQPSNQYAQHIELAVGMSRACQMTTRADLKRVENPNSRVVKVERIPNK